VGALDDHRLRGLADQELHQVEGGALAREIAGEHHGDESGRRHAGGWDGDGEWGNDDAEAAASVQLLFDIDEQPLDKRKVVQLTARYHAAQCVMAGVRRLEDLQAFHTLNPNMRTV
jgi:hypothetical protein